MAKKPKCVDTSTNAYDGSITVNIQAIAANSLDSASFFANYVNNRLPVVLRGHIVDEEWKGAKWTNSYLRKQCGSAVVRVEHRQDSSDHFGKGQEKSMRFESFLDLIESKNENVYMTTQELAYSSEDQPSIISPPLTLLRQDFPLNPKLLDTLIVSNINIWFGASTKPTTSGLHHDFHDNLYILLRGEKHFTLYSPAEACNMYTVGKLEKVHPNGRINYEGQPTRADGADEGVDAALKAAERMKKATEKLEQAEKTAESSGYDASLMNEAEDDVDEALEALLDAEMAANCGEDDDDDFEDESGSEFIEEDEEDGNFDEFSDEQDDEGESEDEQDGAKKKTVDIKQVAKFLGLGKRKRPEDKEGTSSSADTTGTATSTAPSNFSRVDTSLSDAELKASFPLYLEARERAIHVTLKAGQMLYLPAGWFHEVRSQGSADSGGHLAFNYWFHPPDSKEYAKPYTSDFWAKDWEDRMKSGNI